MNLGLFRGHSARDEHDAIKLEFMNVRYIRDTAR